MNHLLFPLIAQLESAALIKCPTRIVRGLAGRYDPALVNKIMFQYKIWSYINEIENYCNACGAFIVLSKSTTNTCSPRCHKIVKRHEVSPIEEIKEEALKRLKLIEEIASEPSDDCTIDRLLNYPWHQINDGWLYTQAPL